MHKSEFAWVQEGVNRSQQEEHSQHSQSNFTQLVRAHLTVVNKRYINAIQFTQ